MEIKKAVITAAGRGVRLYPAADTVQKAMLPLVDRDGLSKPLIQIIAEEALDSGIEEICVVCAPGDEPRYRDAFEAMRTNLQKHYRGVTWALDESERITNLLRRLHFAVQEAPRGYGQAVYTARDFAAGEPVLLLLGDHLYISHGKKRCAQQLLEAARREECAVAAVQATREHLVGRYGTLRCRHAGSEPGLYEIEKIVEKPSLTAAEVELQTPGLRAGYYLCFFGMYALTPFVFEILEEHIGKAEAAQTDVQLTPALDELARRDRHLALELQGARFDIGAQFGLVQTQIALGLDGNSRQEMLALLLETVAEATRRQCAE